MAPLSVPRHRRCPGRVAGGPAGPPSPRPPRAGPNHGPARRTFSPRSREGTCAGRWASRGTARPALQRRAGRTVPRSSPRLAVSTGPPRLRQDCPLPTSEAGRNRVRPPPVGADVPVMSCPTGNILSGTGKKRGDPDGGSSVRVRGRGPPRRVAPRGDLLPLLLLRALLRLRLLRHVLHVRVLGPVSGKGKAFPDKYSSVYAGRRVLACGRTPVTGATQVRSSWVPARPSSRRKTIMHEGETREEGPGTGGPWFWTAYRADYEWLRQKDPTAVPGEGRVLGGPARRPRRGPLGARTPGIEAGTGTHPQARRPPPGEPVGAPVPYPSPGPGPEPPSPLGPQEDPLRPSHG